MKPEQMTCSFEIAQRIAKLGIKMDTYFCYARHGSGDTWRIVKERGLFVEGDSYPAPTVAELGEVLPYRTKSFYTQSMGWWCHIQDCDDPLPIRTICKIDTEANARGDMLCWLVEDGHFKVGGEDAT